YEEDEIINISMADGLSGTYNSACVARGMAENPERIHVINSETLCGPQKYLVDLAAALVEEGKECKEIVDEINKALKESKSYLIPHDFDYLVRGGRISSIVGKIGSAIKLVPVMTMSDDKKSLVKFTTKRTYKKAVQKIIEQMTEDGINSEHKLYIYHACNEDGAEEIKKIILSAIPDADIEVGLLGPAFTTQGGPGCISIQHIKKHDALK
ncbi:DegV family protein, partial [Clostridium sp.]